MPLVWQLVRWGGFWAPVFESVQPSWWGRVELLLSPFLSPSRRSRIGGANLRSREGIAPIKNTKRAAGRALRVVLRPLVWQLEQWGDFWAPVFESVQPSW